MQQRCLNDNLFGYCAGEPKIDIAPFVSEERDMYGGTCKLNKESCGKYKTFSEIVVPKVTVPEPEVETKPIPVANTEEPVVEKKTTKKKAIRSSFA